MKKMISIILSVLMMVSVFGVVTVSASTTSEKSGRYTPVIRTEGSIITEKEEELYNKWVEIFKIKIKNEYGNVFNDFKIQSLAQ